MTYRGEMVNVFGYVWAENSEFRNAVERQKDGLAEHATMTETSVILALSPGSVRKDVSSAKPHAGSSMEKLEKIAAAEDWPGYFGAPALARAEVGREIYGDWLEKSKQLVGEVLSGTDYHQRKRYAALYGDDPADAAAVKVNLSRQEKQRTWLENHVAK